MPKVTKLSRVVTYHDQLPHVKSRDSLITWFSEITRQTKKAVSPLPQCLCPPRLAGW